MNRRQILFKFLLEHPEGIKKALIVDQFNHWYYHNGAFHIGNMLTRMVKAGEAERVKVGVYKAGKGKRKAKGVRSVIVKDFVPDNQTSLF